MPPLQVNEVYQKMRELKEKSKGKRKGCEDVIAIEEEKRKLEGSDRVLLLTKYKEVREEVEAQSSLILAPFYFSSFTGL